MAHLYTLESISHPDQRYVGVTADLIQRLNYHNSGKCQHTSKYMPWKIVYMETFEDKARAFKRERQLKKWSRAKKVALIVGDEAALVILSKSND